MKDRENFRGKLPAESKGCSASTGVDTKYEQFLDKVVKKFPDMKVLKSATPGGSRR